MTRTTAFALALFVSFGSITAGAGLVGPPAGLIVGGVLLALWSWLVLGGDTG